jgi:hypothetical protein
MRVTFLAWFGLHGSKLKAEPFGFARKSRIFLAKAAELSLELVCRSACRESLSAQYFDL